MTGKRGTRTEMLAARCSTFEAKIVSEIARVETGGNHGAALRLLVKEGGERRGLWDTLARREYDQGETTCGQA